jgi:hypothetical protein
MRQKAKLYSEKNRMNIILLVLMKFFYPQEGKASVYNDKVLACPKSTYKHTGLPVCANRELPCGTILTVIRTDNNKQAQCVIADRGPFGVCIKSNKNTRACGFGSRWINGRYIYKYNKPMINAVWRGILDMSRPFARKLGVYKNRLIPIIMYVSFTNNAIFNIVEKSISVH